MSSGRINPAIVLGSSETALGVVRGLHDAGVRALVADHRYGAASASRQAGFVRCPDPRRDDAAFRGWLLEAASRCQAKPVLHVTADSYIECFRQDRAWLDGVAHIRMPPPAILDRLTDKLEQALFASGFGIVVPRTTVITEQTDIDGLPADFPLPAFLKGRESVSWRAAFGSVQKGFVVRSREELRRIHDVVSSKGAPVILQELIPGDDGQHYKVSAVLSAAGTVLAALTLRKIRQSPPGAGVACAIETVPPGALQEQAVAFFERSGLQGVISAEFKFDHRDSRFKLIEINPRYWQQNLLALRAGLNFPWLHHCDASGVALPRQDCYSPGIRWVSLFRDIETFRAMRAEGALTSASWLRSLRGPRTWATLDWRDPAPALWSFSQEVRSHWNGMVRRFGRVGRSGR